jgi:hypothetical protein
MNVIKMAINPPFMIHYEAILLTTELTVEKLLCDAGLWEEYKQTFIIWYCDATATLTILFSTSCLTCLATGLFQRHPLVIPPLV